MPRNQPPDLQTYHAATPNLAQESAVHTKTRKKDHNKHSKGKKKKKNLCQQIGNPNHIRSKNPKPYIQSNQEIRTETETLDSHPSHGIWRRSIRSAVLEAASGTGTRSSASPPRISSSRGFLVVLDQIVERHVQSARHVCRYLGFYKSLREASEGRRQKP